MPEPTTRQQAPASRAAAWVWGWIKSLTVALAIWFVLSTFLVQAFHIPSGSMEKTLLVGDVLFVNKMLYGAEVPLTHVKTPALREPKHDEIVVIKSPIEDILLIKRVIGLPGDTIAMTDGHVIRNGKQLDEPYVTLEPVAPSIDIATEQRMRDWQSKVYLGTVPERYSPDLRTWGPLVIPAGQLMTMGDNRDESFDCRVYGFVPRANLRGAPLFIYYSYDSASWQALPFLTAIRWNRLFTHPH